MIYEMEAQGVRHSTRLRKTVNRYTDDVITNDQPSPPLKRRKTQVAGPRIKLEEEFEAPIKAEQLEPSLATYTIPITEESNVLQSNHDQSDGNGPMYGVKSSHGRATSPDQSHVNTTTNRPARKRRAKKASDPTLQLYGYPAEGTIIPWGTKTRKQPKIYPLPERHGMQDDRPQDWWHATAAERRIERMREAIPKLAIGEPETRLKSYEACRPSWYETFLRSASTQRMFVLERRRRFEDDCHAHHLDCPEEVLTVAGSQGRVYTVTISHLTSCTCPVTVFDSKGEERQCKHVLYVLHHVLKAPPHLRYQAAFLTSELKEMFAHAPPLLLPSPGDVLASAEAADGNRKPVEGDCPICFMDLASSDDEGAVVWCKAACGNNIHSECFHAWALSKSTGPTCPFCRAPWQNDDQQVAASIVTRVAMPTVRGRGGYLDVRDQLAYD